VGLAILALAGVAAAEQGDTEVGFRLLYAIGDATADGTIGSTGSTPTLDGGPGVELNWAIWPLHLLSVELSAAATAHPVELSGGDFDGVDGGTLWRIPLSAVAQYRPDIYGPFNPYFGLGLVYNATTYQSSSSADAVFSEVEFSGELGLVAQVGVDYAIDVRWSANLDLRYMGMKTTGSFVTHDGAVDELELELDPWAIGLGFRFRY
jgi:outer membrane protein W